MITVKQHTRKGRIVRSHARKKKGSAMSASNDRFSKMWDAAQSDPKTAIPEKQLKKAKTILTKKTRSHLVWKNPRTGERQLLPSENARNSVYVGFGIRRGIKKGLGKVKRGLKKLIS